MITREEVKHVAALARLQLSEIEVEDFTQQLSKITQYIDRLAEIDTGDSPRSANAGDSNVWREDEVATSAKAETLLDNAPDAEADYLKIRKIVE